MPKLPKVSVIVPNYNHAAFLNQRIESILNQTYQDFELILIDDCSTDNSREILSQYRQHPKVAHLIFNEENSGSPFIQWEKGIGLAQGEFVWIAESDDWCEPSLLENLIPGLIEDPEVLIAYCQSICIDDNGSVAWLSSHSSLEETISGEEFVRNYMLKKNSIYNASMAVFRKSAIPLEKTYTKFRFCGDWAFWIEVAQKGKVMVSGKILNYFRKHPNDVSSKAFSKGLYLIESTDIILDSIKKTPIPLTMILEIKKQIIHNYLKYEKKFESPKIKKEVLQKIATIDPLVTIKILKAKTFIKIKKLITR